MRVRTRQMALLLLMLCWSSHAAPTETAKDVSSTSVEEIKRPVILTDLTFDSLVNGTSDWMINLHSPWCPACQEMKPVWERLAQKSQGIYQVGTINVQEEKILLHRFQVNALPTVVYVSKGKRGSVYDYKGAFSVNSMHRFAMRHHTNKVHDHVPWLEGCASPVSRCGRILGRIVTTPTWVKKTFVSMRRDFRYGDVALIALILGGPVVMGLMCICLLDMYVVHAVHHRRPHIE